MRVLARWWLRTAAWLEDRVLPHWVDFGQADRMSVGWFHRWLTGRLHHPVESVLGDAFSELVFAQHVRVALTRFTLGDGGIVPTTEVGGKLGDHHGRMADRLVALLHLLSDAGVVRLDGGRVAAGPLADAVTVP